MRRPRRGISPPHRDGSKKRFCFFGQNGFRDRAAIEAHKYFSKKTKNNIQKPKKKKKKRKNPKPWTPKVALRPSGVLVV